MTPSGCRFVETTGFTFLCTVDATPNGAAPKGAACLHTNALQSGSA